MKKVVWISSGLAVIFLILSVITSYYTLKEAHRAISEIGPVSFSETSLDEISNASQKYFDTTSGIGASILFSEAVDNYVDYDKLALAQDEYIALAIEDVLSTEDKENDETLTDRLVLIRETINSFYPDEDYDRIQSYEELEELEQEYVPADLLKSSDS